MITPSQLEKGLQARVKRLYSTSPTAEKDGPGRNWLEAAGSSWTRAEGILRPPHYRISVFLLVGEETGDGWIRLTPRAT